MDEKKEIIDRINRISGKYSAYEVFTDWIRCCAIATSNAVDIFHGKVWKDREKQYIDTISRYTREEVRLFSEMLALLAMALEKKYGGRTWRYLHDVRNGQQGIRTVLYAVSLERTHCRMFFVRHGQEWKIPHQ